MESNELIELSLSEIQEESLKVLKGIDTFCTENNIRYSLAFGTLIGAIRHHGFIPWDDDIDIAMPRPDYERFVKTFHVEGLKCLAPEIGNSFLTFGRIADTKRTRNQSLIRWSEEEESVGIWVDVFPIDGEAEDFDTFMKESSSIWSMVETNQRIRGGLLTPSFSFGFGWNVRIIAKKLLYSWKSLDKIYKQIMQIIHRHPFVNSIYSGVMVYPIYKEHNRTKTGVFESYSKTEFEGGLFSCVSDYDEYLHDIYGDYMKLPPESKRVPNHSGHKFYWR